MTLRPKPIFTFLSRARAQYLTVQPTMINGYYPLTQLAFRACHGLKERKVLEVRRTLHVLDANDDATAALDRAVRQNLKETADRFPMGDVERQVANQVSWDGGRARVINDLSLCYSLFNSFLSSMCFFLFLFWFLFPLFCSSFMFCTFFPVCLFVFFFSKPQFTSQVLSTLHEYPCLEACIPLIHYISDCVRLAWKMTNQTVPYYLDTDFTLGELLLLISKFEVWINYFQKIYRIYLNLDFHSRSPPAGQARTIPHLGETLRHHPGLPVAGVDAERTLHSKGRGGHVT